MENKEVTCRQCGGKGKTTEGERFWETTHEVQCPHCRGTGKVPASIGG